MELDSNKTSLDVSSLQSILTGKSRSAWESADFWRKVCPDLRILSDEDSSRSRNKKRAAAQQSTQEAETQKRRERLVEDGYVLVDDAIEDQELVTMLAAAITTLHKKNLPATFILLYDETWRMAQAASGILASSTHQANEFNFDMLAWYIDPRLAMAGFSPHRDRQPDKSKSSFHDNGMAKYVTMWVALTDATPENSCLYVIPKQFDPGYTEGDDDGDDKASDPLTRALPDKQAYQNIRALPRNAGQSLLFTHRILHWGSRGNPNSHIMTPRIAMSFVSSDPSFEKSYLASLTMENGLPPFKLRLLLVCAQLLIYYQRFDLPKECIKACHDYVKEHEDLLEETYRKKAYVEFIRAMKEDNPVSKSKGGENSDEEDDDAVLEAMLDAEAGGYGEFEDDYDDIVEGDDNAQGEPEEDDFQDNDEPCILFGKRASDESSKEGLAKKVKNTKE